MRLGFWGFWGGRGPPRRSPPRSRRASAGRTGLLAPSRRRPTSPRPGRRPPRAAGRRAAPTTTPRRAGRRGRPASLTSPAPSAPGAARWTAACATRKTSAPSTPTPAVPDPERQQGHGGERRRGQRQPVGQATVHDVGRSGGDGQHPRTRERSAARPRRPDRSRHRAPGARQSSATPPSHHPAATTAPRRIRARTTRIPAPISAPRSHAASTQHAHGHHAHEPRGDPPLGRVASRRLGTHPADGDGGLPWWARRSTVRPSSMDRRVARPWRERGVRAPRSSELPVRSRRMNAAAGGGRRRWRRRGRRAWHGAGRGAAGELLDLAERLVQEHVEAGGDGEPAGRRGGGERGRPRVVDGVEDDGPRGQGVDAGGRRARRRPSRPGWC